jgi:hypothetical protein
MSLIITLNRRGERILPCGTPELIFLTEVYSPSKKTLKVLEVR